MFKNQGLIRKMVNYYLLPTIIQMKKNIEFETETGTAYNYYAFFLDVKGCTG